MKGKTTRYVAEPESYWTSILVVLILCGISVGLIWIFIPSVLWAAIPVIFLAGLCAVFISRFSQRNCIHARNAVAAKNRLEITTKQGKQYLLPYADIKDVKLVVIPMRYGRMDYIVLKTATGNIRLNVIGKRIKTGNLLNRWKYESNNASVYNRLKEMIGGQTDNINGYCTTGKTFFTLLLLFLSLQLSAQNKLERPDRALVDKEVLAQCEREVEKIRRMQLKCDTLMHGVLDVPAEFYFDKQGRLRMWVYHYNWESENGTSAAYYDGNGQLIYIEEAGGTNCDEGEEYFYLHDGRIVDYGFYYSCECCEEDEQEEVEAKLPVVGDLYIDTREDGKYYITTEYVFYTSISRIVNGLGISQFSNFPKLPDTIPQMKAADIRYCQSLQSLPRYFMRDSIDHPKAYILQYFNEANTAIAIEKDNQYLVFSIIPPNEYNEYEIVRENIDGVGSDELIIYLKYSKEYMDTDYEQASQECGVVVWNLDTYECLLNLYLSDQSLYWIYDTSGKKILKESSCIGYEMDLNNKQLSIQRFISGENVSLENKQPANRKIKGCEGCEEVWLEQKHIYKLTESGYVLEKVE